MTQAASGGPTAGHRFATERRPTAEQQSGAEQQFAAQRQPTAGAGQDLDARPTLWVPGGSAAVAGGLGMALLTLGLATARPDVAALGMPLVLGFAWGWFTRPTGQVAGALVPADGAGPVRAHLHLHAPRGTSVVRMRVSTAGYQPAEAVLSARRDRHVTLSLHTARTGVLEAYRVDYVPAAHGEVLAAHCPPLGPARLLVRPRIRPLRRLPLPFRLQGLVGPHTSRRVGEGLELHDIHEFTPGDRLRRIDWRTTVRRSFDPRTGSLGELYVRRTLASADATVMLVVDSRDEVGPDVDTWAGGAPTRMTQATSLDLAREAAASVARHVLDRGDRVGLDDLGRQRRPVPPAAGSKHAERIIQRLTRIAPEGSPKPRLRSPRLPSGALVVIFSTFLDDEAGTVAALWRSQGHRVLAVDVLPTLTTANLDPHAATSYRLIRLERGLRLADLRRQGIDVIHWAGDPDGHGSDLGAQEALLLASSPRRGGR